MSFEMHPSPVTGLRRRKDELNREIERTETGGDLAEEEVVEVDDNDDIGDIWFMVAPWMIEDTSKGGAAG